MGGLSTGAPPRRLLFLVASAREADQTGNTEWLARHAARALPTTAVQRWMHLPRRDMPEFVDRRHTVASYPLPEGSMRELLDATMECTD
ncbi:MAG: flavodoxin family protein, partial [Phycisphaerae bacterium]|nr:flavodoxin family protein [Phycisphaerae bacterium]